MSFELESLPRVLVECLSPEKGRVSLNLVRIASRIRVK